MWERGPSPAAAAAVSRKLADAGIPKAREIQKGWETAGYAVELRSDCVRVEWVPGLFESDEDPALIAAGLDRCVAALTRYRVERKRGQVAHPGGYHDEEILEVRP